MFGHKDDDDNQTAGTGATVEPQHDGVLSTPSFGATQDDSTTPALPSEPTGSPHIDPPSAPHVDDATSSDSDNNDAPKVEDDTPNDSTSNTVDDNHDDLLAIKQQALTELSPLVGHLDQSPEDKFKTLMMMIQANDNKSLINDAYEAAQQISDDKAKSQALLDIVNEINYFTQKNN